MGVLSAFRKPRAADLAEQIAALRPEVAALAERYEQAEAAAVERAADDTAYRDAADEADRLRVELADKRARLERLEKAHADGLTRERDEEIARVEGLLKGLHEERRRTYSETADAEKEELRRHEEAIEALKLRRDQADRSIRLADSLLGDLRDEKRHESMRRDTLKQLAEAMKPNAFQPEKAVQLREQLAVLDGRMAALSEKLPERRERVAALSA